MEGGGLIPAEAGQEGRQKGDGQEGGQQFQRPEPPFLQGGEARFEKAPGGDVLQVVRRKAIGKIVLRLLRQDRKKGVVAALFQLFFQYGIGVRPQGGRAEEEGAKEGNEQCKGFFHLPHPLLDQR